MWAEYARLRDEEGWTQQKIADAKGVTQQMVSMRLKLHTLPVKIKRFTSQGILTEAHLVEIAKIQVDLCFSPWLTTEQAWAELAGGVVEDIDKNGDKSVKATRGEAWVALIGQMLKSGGVSYGRRYQAL